MKNSLLIIAALIAVAYVSEEGFPFAEKKKTVAIVELLNTSGEWEQVAMINGFWDNQDAAQKIVETMSGDGENSERIWSRKLRVVTRPMTQWKYDRLKSRVSSL